MRYSRLIQISCQISCGILILLACMQTTSAAWYGGYSLSTGSSITRCSSDGQFDGTPPSPSSDTLFPGTYGVEYTDTSGWQSRVSSSWAGGIYCQYWDATVPSIASVNYADGWSNNPSVSVSVIASDYGGSNLSGYQYYVSYSDASPDFSSGWTSYTQIGGLTANTSIVYTDSARSNRNRAYKFAVVVFDGAGNVSDAKRGSNTYRVDTQPPVVTTGNFTDSSGGPNLVANIDQRFSAVYSDGAGSPLASWSGNFTDATTNAQAPVSGTTTDYTIRYTGDISNVQRNLSNGGRPYQWNITQVCDAAGNCAGWSAGFSYVVYANPMHSPTLSVDTNSISPGSAVADGTPYELTYVLMDGYGNLILPASGINRTLAQEFTYKNTNYLNQHTRADDSAVFVSNTANPSSVRIPIAPVGTETFSIPGVLTPNGVNSWKYRVNFSAYAPTASGYAPGTTPSDSSSAFTLNEMRIRVTDPQFTNTVVSDSTSVDGKWKVPYLLELTGDIRTGGLIEGTIQQSTLSIQSQTSLNAASPEISVQFVDNSSTPSFTFHAGTDHLSMENASIGVSRNLLAQQFAFPSSSSSTQSPLYTTLEQIPGTTVGRTNNTVFSTHLAYRFDGKTAVINGPVVWKTSYWGDVRSTTLQNGVKIVGLTASDEANQITTNQFSENVTVLSWVSKEDTRLAIRRAASVGTRSLRTEPVSGSLSSSDMAAGRITSWSMLNGASIAQDDGVVYLYEATSGGQRLLLQDASGVYTVSGKRTIVTKGLNVFIRANIAYDTGGGNLAIIALKDDSGQGGNIYIDPSVTNISGFLYADGALVGFDGTDELGAGVGIDKLQNQLYIYGSVISANSLGGATKSPVYCPSIIGNASCDRDLAQKYDLNFLHQPRCIDGGNLNHTFDRELAQKYDLNFLRRYTLVDAENSGGTAWIKIPNRYTTTKVMGGATCNLDGNCSGAAPRLRTISTTTDSFAAFPVVIEYNPNFIKDPPPLLSSIR